jgi:plasmid maintenance system antidote protein VapI
VLDDGGITANALALALRIRANRLTEISGKSSVSADTALRLARFFTGPYLGLDLVG